VALGHIHKRQVLHEHPPVVYSGSMARIDFGEEKDDKGFYVVDLDAGKETGSRLVSYEFHPVKSRRFLTIDVTLKEEDHDPTSVILNAINLERQKVADAVVRVNIKVPSSLESQLRTNDVKEALKDAHNFSVSKNIERETRVRIGSRQAEDISPVDALKAYLETQNIPVERRKTLLEYGEKLMDSREPGS
jgi:DNA repair protein SbcD/Mre11